MQENLVLALFGLLPCLGVVALRFFALRRRKTKGAPSWGQLLVGNGLVLVFLLSLVPLGGELYFRYVFDSTDALDCTKVSKRWFARYWRENALHLRDEVPYSLTCAPGKRRVSFVGDSFTAGHGIKQVEQRFVNLLRQAHPEWEVHMLAQLGADTGGEIQYLQEGIRHGYQLDQVVLVYCLNDTADLMPSWGQAVEQFAAETAQAGWLRRNSYFFDLLCNRWQASRNPYLKSYFSFVAQSYQGDLWRQQQARLKALRDLVQEHGGRLSVVTFPFVHALGPHYEFGPAHEALSRLWGELQVPHLDLLSVYQDRAASQLTVNAFDAHPNELAHHLAAQAIDQFLSPQLTPGLAAPKANRQ